MLVLALAINGLLLCLARQAASKDIFEYECNVDEVATTDIFNIVLCRFEAPVDERQLRYWAEQVHSSLKIENNKSIVIGWMLFLDKENTEHKLYGIGSTRFKDGKLVTIHMPIASEQKDSMYILFDFVSKVIADEIADKMSEKTYN
jgi:hypothetical protein